MKNRIIQQAKATKIKFQPHIQTLFDPMWNNNHIFINYKVITTILIDTTDITPFGVVGSALAR